ncbi:hypothetical protein NJ76_31575 [Rhodococcus sp. IITR03]|nr:hypothetical protein NJ76_31575 [Rhodococcus sp. IITR03]
MEKAVGEKIGRDEHPTRAAGTDLVHDCRDPRFAGGDPPDPHRGPHERRNHAGRHVDVAAGARVGGAGCRKHDVVALDPACLPQPLDENTGESRVGSGG